MQYMVLHGIINKSPIYDSYTVTSAEQPSVDSLDNCIPVTGLHQVDWVEIHSICASLNHCKVKKTERSRLIPRQLAANLELLNVS